MITTQCLSAIDRGQLERKELARGSWREGQPDNALLIIRSVLAEEMSPAVAAECFSAEAGFLLAQKDFSGALASLHKMAPFLDAADQRIQGTFFLQRARAHRHLDNTNSALTDYSGALALWQECGDKNYEGAASINLAELYLILKNVEQARANIVHALAVLPVDSEYWCDAYDTKAKVLLAEGNISGALDTIDQAISVAGENELRQKTCADTREQIKDHLLDLLIPLIDTDDLDDLKVQMIRHALDRTGGSITAAAELINTSHQVVAYTAQKHGLERSPQRKKSIIKNLR